MTTSTPATVITAWLTPAEIVQLTERVRHSAQCRALDGMGVPYRPNAIGRPLVERTAVLSSPAPRRQRAPQWDRIKKNGTS